MCRTLYTYREVHDTCHPLVSLGRKLCSAYVLQSTLYTSVYLNLATSSENYRTFPKVGPHYKEKACKFLARSDYSLRPNSCVLYEIFVA